MREEIEAAVRQQFPDAILEAGEATGTTLLVVRREQIVAVSRFLKDKLGFVYPECLTGVDRGENFEVVYNLYSPTRKEALMVKVSAPRADPTIDSVIDIWPGVDWHEREAYDLLGITFKGHPDLRRILLPDDWEGFPLRKDYAETD